MLEKKEDGTTIYAGLPTGYRGEDELRRLLKSTAGALEYLLETCVEPPDENCSCHISPPCNDCVEWFGLREAISQAKDALDAVNSAQENKQ